ncbi:MAG: metal-dependent hydrolase [Halobacteriaceae archaeon]
MFIGHAVLAFVMVAAAAVGLGRSRRTALCLGGLAGLFATVPDIDMVFAVAGLFAGGDAFAMADGFWRASTVVHRGATHSLLVGVPAAVAFGLLGDRSRIAVTILAGLVVTVGIVTGPLAAGSMAVFGVVGGLLGYLASRWPFSTRDRVAVAAVGVLTHPFGDVFTGTPPAFFYPLEWTVVATRVAPFPDPTLDLLLAFGVEVTVLWAGVATVAWLTHRSIRGGVDRRAGIGAGYAVAALVLTPPTMAVSYQFVFSVLALGIVGVVPTRRPLETVDTWTIGVTGLAAITVGWIAYTGTYLLVGT